MYGDRVWLSGGETLIGSRGSDSVPGPKEDHANESDLHHIEGEGREGIDQWSDKAVVLSEEDEDDEDDSESALDINYDEDDGDLKTDGACASNAIALAAKKSSESRPSFGNIVVNSSSDVHFGNKTFYNGPVTIKQFVYTTRDCSEPGDTSVGDKVLDPVTSGQPNGKEQCPTPADENVLSVTSIQTLTSEPSPEINGSFLPIWQPSRSDQPSLPIRKSSVTQWVRKVVKTRRCLAIFATLSTCAVVLLVTLLVLLLPRYDEPSPGTSDQLPEDGDISDTFKYNATDNTPSGKLTIVNRRTWLAQPPVRRSNSLQHPVPIVVILHTATENCSTQAECVYLVRHTQTFHIESNGWNDIGYSFMVGGDGNVYEGRGWDTEGAFARGYNNRSIGIAFIGTFIDSLPPPKQILPCKQLIALGVELGKISPDYKTAGTSAAVINGEPRAKAFRGYKDMATLGRKTIKTAPSCIGPYVE